MGSGHLKSFRKVVVLRTDAAHGWSFHEEVVGKSTFPQKNRFFARRLGASLFTAIPRGSFSVAKRHRIAHNTEATVLV